ncbi:plasma-membrane choline transporter-domain-containing protein [Zopfochytrium polystomum]|nr:plasma-membrane choline transporter-domain-containing protein [Zopfochytrium polystomum]
MPPSPTTTTTTTSPPSPSPPPLIPASLQQQQQQQQHPPPPSSPRYPPTPPTPQTQHSRRTSNTSTMLAHSRQNSLPSRQYSHPPLVFSSFDSPSGSIHGSDDSSPNASLINKDGSPRSAASASSRSFKSPFDQRPVFHDIWATLAYLAFVGCFMAVVGIGLPQAFSNSPSSGSNSLVARSDLTAMLDLAAADDETSAAKAGAVSDRMIGMPAKDIRSMTLTGVMTALIITTAWFTSMLYHPNFTLHASYVGSATLLLITGLYFALNRVWVAAVIWFAFALVVLFFYWYVTTYIPLATALLRAAGTVMRRWGGTVVASVVGMGFAVLFGAVWVLAVMGANQWAEEKNGPLGLRVVVGIFCLVFFFWTNEIARHVVHYSVAGTFATYYLLGIPSYGGANGSTKLPVTFVTTRTAGRALTTAFGPLCFGSLFISLAETLKSCASLWGRAGDGKPGGGQDSRGGGNWPMQLCCGCIETIATAVDDLCCVFNKYTLTTLALTSGPYCATAHSTATLLTTRSLAFLFRDTLIAHIVGTAAAGAAVGSGCAAYAYLNAVGWTARAWGGGGAGAAGSGAAAVACVAAVGAWAVLVAAEGFVAGVAATLVCFAQDPDAVAREHPALVEAMLAAWPEVGLRPVVMGGDDAYL